MEDFRKDGLALSLAIGELVHGKDLAVAGAAISTIVLALDKLYPQANFATLMVESITGAMKVPDTKAGIA